MDHVLAKERTRYAVGVALLLLVVLLWTGSNFVTQVRPRRSLWAVLISVSLSGRIQRGLQQAVHVRQ